MLRTLTILCGVATGVALPTADAPANDLRSLLFGSFRPAPTPCPDAHTLVMTTQEVLQQQKIWGDTVVAIGAAHTANPTGQEHIKIATDAASNIYAYDHLLVMFKPTLASDVQFRPNPQDALSYFVGHSDHIAGAPGIHMEDTGFAVKPWSSVVFHNHGIYCSGDICHAMGV
ncbi:hypothetical protein KFE25_009198 [Diacronema lutheri]|uniref:Uncharacterized protein n=1 Tax=Diacronema lutheri TaxID=2081491 RepID=A0A8J5XYF1_DIALT|nr:hypothetical protein KFE25_009198 [Diacronema lutheri]